jgi:hypothetical protein
MLAIKATATSVNEFHKDDTIKIYYTVCCFLIGNILCSNFVSILWIVDGLLDISFSPSKPSFRYLSKYL